jgi:hypothetical protein
MLHYQYQRRTPGPLRTEALFTQQTPEKLRIRTRILGSLYIPPMSTWVGPTSYLLPLPPFPVFYFRSGLNLEFRNPPVSLGERGVPIRSISAKSSRTLHTHFGPSWSVHSHSSLQKWTYLLSVERERPYMGRSRTAERIPGALDARPHLSGHALQKTEGVQFEL